MVVAPHANGVEATGTALPVHEAYLSAPVPGKIASIPVVLGQAVKKGDVLMRFDPQGYALTVEQATAGVAAATVQADQAANELERVGRLVKAKVVPGANYDQIKAAAEAAEAAKRGAEAGMKQAQKALADSVLRAPFDGVVDGILKEVGEYAPAMPPTMLIKLVDASSLEIQTFLPESRGDLVEVGDLAEVEIQSAGVKTQGRVTFVSNRIQPGTQTFEVRVEIGNRGGKIKGGAFARVVFGEHAAPEIVLSSANVVRAGDGSAHVFVVDGETARRVAVTLGETRDPERVVVQSGLALGQRVITSDLSALSDGDRVEAATHN
jgi:RND family efflux transporter MFP subunit